MATITQFLDALRGALNHLYNPNVQRTSPLVGMLGLTERSNVSYALQQALIEGIESLKVGPDVPARSPLRRTYEVLLFRYVQQWSQQEVADQLGISRRHLRREQQLALEVLAQRLSERFHMSLEAGCDRPSDVSVPPDEEDSTVDDELAWLQGAPPPEPVNLAEAVDTVLNLARPVAREHGVTLQCDAMGTLPLLTVHPVALRQILLSLVGMAVLRTPGGRIIVEAAVARQGVEVTIRAPEALPGALSEGELAKLEIVHRVLRSCMGQLQLGSASAPFAAKVSLPTREQVPVLIIDDNADTLALIERYLAGSRYHYCAARTLAEALEIARRDAPRLIVLDVMMPEMDGWELLGRLRQHPLTQRARIIICSILAEEELALSLGASAFLHKPVNRETLLQVLDRQLGV